MNIQQLQYAIGDKDPNYYIDENQEIIKLQENNSNYGSVGKGGSVKNLGNVNVNRNYVDDNNGNKTMR